MCVRAIRVFLFCNENIISVFLWTFSNILGFQLFLTRLFLSWKKTTQQRREKKDFGDAPRFLAE